jgi:hypothetical protein
MGTPRRLLGLATACLVAIGCAGGNARSASAASSDDASDVRIEYVPIGLNWVKHHTKNPPADTARKLADEMLSRMQSSNESLDAIAVAAVGAVLGPAAVSDPKRRKMVSLSAPATANADLPPDAREALAAFARKAKPGDVVDSPLGAGPVLVVARAVR